MTTVLVPRSWSSLVAWLSFSPVLSPWVWVHILLLSQRETIT